MKTAHIDMGRRVSGFCAAGLAAVILGTGAARADVADAHEHDQGSNPGAAAPQRAAVEAPAAALKSRAAPRAQAMSALPRSAAIAPRVEASSPSQERPAGRHAAVPVAESAPALWQPRSWLANDVGMRLPLGGERGTPGYEDPDLGAPEPYRVTGMAAGEGDTSLAEANQAIANPLARSTLFIMENNLITLDGDATRDSRRTNVFIIDPLIPMPLGDTGWTVIHRPILPFIMDGDVPVGAGPGAASTGLPTFENESGIGDFTYFAAFSPKPKDGVSWGIGPIVRLPTATESSIGSEKLSIGPMAVAVKSGKKLTYGFLNQNLFSVAGEGGRADVATSTLQYFAFYNFTDSWGIGTAPIISYDWNAESGDKWSVPVGLGITHTFRVMEKIPARFLVEGQYYVKQRDTFGPEWNFRLALALFLPRPGS